jgi:membrane protease YdiL (CAAX protease family)
MSKFDIIEIDKKDLRNALFITLILFGFYLFFIWEKTQAKDLIISSFYFLLIYFVFFSIDKKTVRQFLSNRISQGIKASLLFPLILLVIFYSYIIFNSDKSLSDTTLLFPFYIVFPVIIFYKRKNVARIDWLDFVTFALLLLPATLIKFEPNTSLPISGGGFDSVFRIIIILIAVYSFSIVREIDNIGFYAIFKVKYLCIALFSWISFYAIGAVIGFYFNFLKFVGYEEISVFFFINIFRKIITVFLHTAIFEELFFRGILQNLLAKRINQSFSWKKFWYWGFGILAIFSILIGYSLRGEFGWFPVTITTIIFVIAFIIEKKEFGPNGSFTSLAITSVIFGLVHFHAGSIIFVGLASVAGWAYGYTYYKTKNVFYAALVHSLVNNTYLFLGLELLK